MNEASRQRPPGLGSVRIRLALLYSVVVFGLAAVLVAAVYVAMSRSLASEPVTAARVVFVEGERVCTRVRDMVMCGPADWQPALLQDVRTVERAVNQRALEQFRSYAFTGLGGLFVVSLVVGWVVAGQVLAPIGRITGVARDIQATDLSRRIRLGGPDDELRRLADTFDGMLDRVEAAFEQQRSFIHEASHELRNPIAVIRTNVDVALSDPDAPAEELADTLRVVGRAAERMGVLVDDLLVYARRESPALREATIDLRDVVADTAAEFAAPADTRSLTLHWSAPPGLWVHGDPVALKRALANLLANAVRLAPAGSSVRLAAGRDGEWTWFAVQDEGPGIPEEHHERVFDRFYRGDPARARAEGRSGLGLTIVRQIAEAHRGTVGLRSAPGSGSTFSVWLPSTDPVAGVDGTGRSGRDQHAERSDGVEVLPAPARRLR